MAREHEIARCRRWYARLLCLYPKPYRRRFGESMEQTFNDLYRERREANDGLSGFLFWIFVETFTGIMRENFTVMIMQNKSVVRAAVGTGCILMIPLVLTLLNPNAQAHGGNGGGWDWGPEDFIAMGILLFGTGLALQFSVKTLANPVYRIVAGSAIVLAFLAVWVELSVDGVSRALALLF